MEIIINNKAETINGGTSLGELIAARLGEKQKGIAVAVNESVIPRSSWSQLILNPNDNILIIKATQGG